MKFIFIILILIFNFISCNSGGGAEETEKVSNHTSNSVSDEIETEALNSCSELADEIWDRNKEKFLDFRTISSNICSSKKKLLNKYINKYVEVFELNSSQTEQLLQNIEYNPTLEEAFNHDKSDWSFENYRGLFKTSLCSGYEQINLDVIYGKYKLHKDNIIPTCMIENTHRLLRSSKEYPYNQSIEIYKLTFTIPKMKSIEENSSESKIIMRRLDFIDKEKVVLDKVITTSKDSILNQTGDEEGVADAGQTTDYYSLNTIVHSKDHNSNENRPYIWSSSVNVPESNQNIFLTDARFNIRIRAKEAPPKGNDSHGVGCDYQDFESWFKYTKLDVDLCIRKASETDCHESHSFNNIQVNSASQVKKFSVPNTSQPLVIDILDVKWDTGCLYDRGQSERYCPTFRVWKNDCVEFDLQFSTDYTKDFPEPSLYPEIVTSTYATSVVSENCLSPRENNISICYDTSDSSQLLFKTYVENTSKEYCYFLTEKGKIKPVSSVKCFNIHNKNEYYKIPIFNEYSRESHEIKGIFLDNIISASDVFKQLKPLDNYLLCSENDEIKSSKECTYFLENLKTFFPL